MIRITLIKLLSFKSFAHISVSYCIGAVMNNFAFQKEAGMQADAWYKSLLLPALKDRLGVNRISKYEAIGLQGHKSEVAGNVLVNNTFPVLLDT